MRYEIFNYEDQAEDVRLGCIETDLKGRATLYLNGDGKGAKRDYPNPNAALREVREMRGWPNAYLVKASPRR